METNGRVVNLSKVVQEVRDRLLLDDGSLLPDIAESHPGLRAFLLGGLRDGETWPPGALYVARDGNDVLCRVSLRQLELECVYRGGKICELIECIENDLTTQRTNWTLDYKGRQREERKRLTE